MLAARRRASEVELARLCATLQLGLDGDSINMMLEGVDADASGGVNGEEIIPALIECARPLPRPLPFPLRLPRNPPLRVATEPPPPFRSARCGGGRLFATEP